MTSTITIRIHEGELNCLDFVHSDGWRTTANLFPFDRESFAGLRFLAGGELVPCPDSLLPEDGTYVWIVRLRDETIISPFISTVADFLGEMQAPSDCCKFTL